MKILLAIDGSTFSDRAVQEVVHRPWPARSEVKIISVIEPMAAMMTETWVLPDNYWDDARRAATEQAQAALDAAVSRFKESATPTLNLTTEIHEGYPKRVILDEAERWGANLIVVGSHGYSGFKRLLLGSVSQAVASHARCSVEIVRGPEHD
ncbi:MAG TPA: universal stress protein [Blastocatellia bacterium]|nr:universal stress protein [Blastocatellia bacterium]